MKRNNLSANALRLPPLSDLPISVRCLITAVIVSLSIGMAGAIAQIVVHDIIPTFWDKTETSPSTHSGPEEQNLSNSSPRGDLFGGSILPKEAQGKPPFFKSPSFVWALKWTHIHLFGMSMIFFFVGMITLMLDMGDKAKAWLICLPFIGIWIDILAVWLKLYVSPVFFWLHIPGGNMFTLIFIFVALRALWEMWFQPHP